MLVPVGSLPASALCRRIDRNGITHASITASDSSASGFGRDCTITLQRRQVESWATSPAAACRRSEREGRTTRCPKRDSSAGTTVNEATSTSSTVMIDAIDSPYMNATPVANMPSSAMITVLPASRIALPEVSIASITAASTSPVRR